MEICIGSTFSIFSEPFFYSLCFFCDIKSNLITLFICTLFGNVYLSHLWMDKANAISVSPAMTLIILVGLILIGIAFIITYVSQLQKKLRMQMSEYFNLINRMREGVLVLSLGRLSGEHQIDFCNKTVTKLLKSSESSEPTETVVKDKKGNENENHESNCELDIKDLSIARFLTTSLVKGTD